MNTVAELTVPEKILLAALHLEEQGQSPFSAEALIVGAWQEFPRTFGLKGYTEQYPDSNKVLASIMGVKGLARRGWLVKMGQKLYSLSREGKQVIERLLHQGEEAAKPAPAVEQPTKSRLNRVQEKFFLDLWACTAVEKYQQGRKPELTFADASRFWGISENMRGPALDAHLDQLHAGLAELREIVSHGSVTLSNGRSISSEDIELLLHVQECLEERFMRHLNLLRHRAGRG